MNIRTLMTISVLGLTATACTSNTQPTAQPSNNNSSYSSPTAQTTQDETVSRNAKFECRNGMTVTLKQSNVNSVTIYVDTNNSSATLYRTQAASGALYANKQGLSGKNTEWHEKGGEAAFEFTDPYGNVTETVCKAK